MTLWHAAKEKCQVQRWAISPEWVPFVLQDPFKTPFQPSTDGTVTQQAQALTWALTSRHSPRNRGTMKHCRRTTASSQREWMTLWMCNTELPAWCGCIVTSCSFDWLQSRPLFFCIMLFSFSRRSLLCCCKCQRALMRTALSATMEAFSGRLNVSLG